MNWRKPIINMLLSVTGSKVNKSLVTILNLERQPRFVLKKYQETKLKKLILHCYHKVPYYKRLLSQSKVVSKGRVNLSNYEKLPILTKEIIRKESKNLRSRDIGKRKWYYNSSGGSTGEPIRFVQDRNYSDWNIANKIYYKTFVNQKIGDTELRLWGSERDILEGKDQLSIRLRNWLYNRKEFNAFRMSNKLMAHYLKEWNKFKPTWIEAYVQSIYEFAQFINRNNLRVHSPKGVLTAAGILHPEMKQLIQDVFNCPVFNRYGSREVGDMACSCLINDSLHISMWNQYIEILDNELKHVKPGKSGKVYVTNLNNYSMPLLRYDIGDIAEVPKKVTCDCGRNTELIKSIKGREVHIFRTEEDELIDGEYFTHLFYLKDWVKKFQVVQHKLDQIEIKVVLSQNKDQKDINYINYAIRKVMGKNCRIQWNFVKDIPPLKSGKYLYTISKLKNVWD